MQKNISEVLNEIKPEGFNLKLDYKGYASFERVEEQRILVIGFGDITNGRFMLMRSWLSIFKIEEILRPAFINDKNLNENTTITTDEHGFIHNKPIGQGVYEHLPFELNSEEALAKMQMLIKRFIEQDAFPFFEYWTDIRAFLPFIESVPFTELHQYFYNDGVKRKLIIWKLCNHPQFENYKNERLAWLEEYASNKPNDPFAQRGLKSMITLIKQLEKTKPLFEWDPAYLIPKEL